MWRCRRIGSMRIAVVLCCGLVVVCDKVACADILATVASSFRPWRRTRLSVWPHVTVNSAFVTSTCGAWWGAGLFRMGRPKGLAARAADGARTSRSLSMKAKKTKRKRESQSGEGGGVEDGGRRSSSPRRVVPNAPISVRAQIQYVRMRKSIENTHKSSKTKVPNAFRRAKSTDYEDIVEPEDLSHVYMPSIDPSLLVDGYNIIYHWPKSSMMAVKGDLEGARNVLLDELSAVANMRGWTVTVVFDAHKKRGADRRTHTATENKVNAVFTGADETADMYVERHTMELKDSGCPSVMVATGDRLMQNLVASAGAEVFSPDRIVEVIGRGLDVCDCLKFIRVIKMMRKTVSATLVNHRSRQEIQICRQEAMALTQSYIDRKQKLIDESEMSAFSSTVRHYEKKNKSALKPKPKPKPKPKQGRGNFGKGPSGGNGGREYRDLDLEEMFGGA